MHLNRDIPGLLGQAGFHSADMQSMYLPVRVRSPTTTGHGDIN